eukprot:5540371-Prymnesium_polylepis.1
MSPQERQKADEKERDDLVAQARRDRDEAWQDVEDNIDAELPAEATENDRFSAAWTLTKRYIWPIDKQERDAYISYYTNEKNWKEGWTEEYHIQKKKEVEQVWKATRENRKIDLVREERFLWSDRIKKLKTRLHRNAPLVKEFAQQRKLLLDQLAEAKKTDDTVKVRQLREDIEALDAKSSAAYNADVYDSRVNDFADELIKNVFKLENSILAFVALIDNGKEGSPTAIPQVVANIKDRKYDIPIPELESVINPDYATRVSSLVLAAQSVERLENIRLKEQNKKLEQAEKRRVASERVIEDRAELDLLEVELDGFNNDDDIIVLKEDQFLGEQTEDFDVDSSREARARQRALRSRFIDVESDEALTKQNLQELWQKTKASADGQTYHEYLSAAYIRYSEDANRNAIVL